MGDDVVRGKRGRDVLVGGPGDDRMFGGPYGDGFVGNAGDDQMRGGGGVDRAEYWDARGRVRVDLAAGTARGRGRDTLVSIESAIGSESGDRDHRVEPEHR
jgi:Ca2+-binding RTX toxin-like protein